MRAAEINEEAVTVVRSNSRKVAAVAQSTTTIEERKGLTVGDVNHSVTLA
jgi:hypothetical protein